MRKPSLLLCCVLSLLLTPTLCGAGAGVMSPGLLASPLLQAVDHDGKIEAKYDGFNHETVITLRKMKVTCGGAKGLQSTVKDTCVSISAALHAPGKQLDYVRYVTLQLIFETKDWDRRHSLAQRDLAIVAGGETIRLGRMALANQGVDTDRLIDVMKEVLEVSISYQNFNKMARADFVEIRVGNSEFALQEKNLAALRDLNNRIKF
jgi:hypothetical protein